jgi:TonB-dependent receptor
VYLNSLNLFSADYKENDQVYKADLKFPFSVGSDLLGFLKFGGEYRYNYRKNNQHTPYARIDRGSNIQNEMSDSLINRFHLILTQSNGRFSGTNFSSTDPELLSGFLDNRFGGVLWVPEAGVLNSMVTYVATTPQFNAINGGGTNPGGWFDGAYEQLANYYKYIEKYYGAYAMSELNIGPDLRIVGGARFEQDRSLYEAFNMKDGRNPGTQVGIPITAYPQDRFWLPMVQAKYNVTDWMDVRYAYTQTLARPDFGQLSPHFTMDFSRQNVWAGNPRLQSGHAYSHDVILTFHNNDLGLLSVGAFYKTISKFTYYTQYKLHVSSKTPPGRDSLEIYNVGGVFPQDGATLNTYINSPYDAFVKGVETDFQTRLWYLPEPLNGIVLGMNYAHIWSKTTYPWKNDQDVFIPPRTHYIRYVDSTRTGRLINQPDDVFNAYLGYDYAGFSVRLSFLFQGNSVSAIGAYPEYDGFTKDYFRMDASARQILPWAGLQVFLDVFNINERMNSSAQTTIGGFTSQQHYGLTANLGVRYVLQ